MAETQRHEGEFRVPPARHRAPSRHHAMNGTEMQPGEARDRLVKQIIGYLASLLCLAGAVYYLWDKQDMMSFLVLIGVATGQIPIWRAIGRMDRQRRTGPLSVDVGEDDSVQ